MSEYQFVAFRAIDAPPGEKNLAFKRRQSSRATVTATPFKNDTVTATSAATPPRCCAAATISISALQKDLGPMLRETERLVKNRSLESYRQVVSLPVELRGALAGTGQSGLAERRARALAAKNPTLNRFKSELREKKLL